MSHLWTRSRAFAGVPHKSRAGMRGGPGQSPEPSFITSGAAAAQNAETSMPAAAVSSVCLADRDAAADLVQLRGRRGGGLLRMTCAARWQPPKPYQQAQTLFQIRQSLKAAGGSMADVVKVTIFVTDITSARKSAARAGLSPAIFRPARW